MNTGGNPPRPAMDWIHCNRCMVGAQACRDFHLTTCGHLFCGRCVTRARGGAGVCLWCKTQCSYSPVNKDLSPHYQMFFKNPVDDLNNAVKCVRFQNMHRTILLQHGKRLQRVHQNLRHEIAVQCEESRRLDVAAEATSREVNHLRTQLERIEQRRQQYQQRSLVPRTFTPSVGEIGFGNRISPYDVKCSGRSSGGVMPSFLERQQSTMMSRTFDSCSSSNTPMLPPSSTGRYSPYRQPPPPPPPPPHAPFSSKSRPNTPAQRHVVNSPFQQKLDQLSLNHSINAKSTLDRPTAYPDGNYSVDRRRPNNNQTRPPMFARRPQRPFSAMMSRPHPNMSPPLVQD